MAAFCVAAMVLMSTVSQNQDLRRVAAGASIAVVVKPGQAGEPFERMVLGVPSAIRTMTFEVVSVLASNEPALKSGDTLRVYSAHDERMISIANRRRQTGITVFPIEVRPDVKLRARADAKQAILVLTAYDDGAKAYIHPYDWELIDTSHSKAFRDAAPHTVPPTKQGTR